MIVWDHWHIEPSSICALQCPRCPRAEVPENLLNRQLTLDFFVNQVGAETIKQIKKITFCGNDGDPIYCRDFLEICSWIKETNPSTSLVLITNGSYKNLDFWERLATILDDRDEIHWSLDGWDQLSNEQYRVHSDWRSIAQGIQTFRYCNSKTYTVWASIAFKFNEHSISYQKALATTWGFDLFQLTKSTKFGSKYPEAYGDSDALEPADRSLVASGHRFERQLVQLTNKVRPGQELKTIFLQRAQNLDKHTQYSGICLIGNKGVFVSSQGDFYPCCWTANRYEHNQPWHTLAKSKFNLYNKTFKEIISDPFWTTDFLKFDSFECTTKCTRDQLSDLQHTTEW